MIQERPYTVDELTATEWIPETVSVWTQHRPPPPNGSVARRRLNSACPICTPGAKGLFKWGDALDHLLASHPSLVSWERNIGQAGALLGGFRCCCGFVTTSTDSMMDHLKQTDLVDHFTLAKIGAPDRVDSGDRVVWVFPSHALPEPHPLPRAILARLGHGRALLARVGLGQVYDAAREAARATRIAACLAANAAEIAAVDAAYAVYAAAYREALAAAAEQAE